jgi:hypothetical protein
MQLKGDMHIIFGYVYGVEFVSRIGIEELGTFINHHIIHTHLHRAKEVFMRFSK